MATRRPKRVINPELFFYTFLMGAIVGLFVLMKAGCLEPAKTTVIEVGDDKKPPAECNGLALGDTRIEQCPAGQEGQRIYVCRESGEDLAMDTCKPPDNTCDVVSFADIKKIFTDECVLCHFSPNRYDEYETAKGKIDETIRRINLGNDNPERMPKEPKQGLDAADIKLIEAWKAEGLRETDECDDPGTDDDHVNLFDVESSILEDLTKVDSDDRQFTRYLITSHKTNQGATDERKESARDGVEKTLNSINADLEDLYKTVAVDDGFTVYRFDLRSYSLTRNDWKLVEDADKLDLESFTDEGETIKFLTGARKAWFHYDNFIEITQNAAVYYAIMDVPVRLADLLRDIGVNVAAQFEDFSASFLGFTGSEIVFEGNNRLIVRFDSRDGYAWITFDIGPLVDDEQNLFQFPCLGGTGCDEFFEFAASEIIWTLPNGMQGYALYNAAGIRQDAANLELRLVRDTRSPVEPEIQNAHSCHRCHSSGILVATDQIRAHVSQNGALFDADDREIILELYKSKASNDAQFVTDNRIFQTALQTIGIEPEGIDPVSRGRDDMFLTWNLEKLASFLLLTPEELTEGLRGSGAGSIAVGQLLSGGAISFEQLIEIIDDLKDDLRLFQEDL